MRTRAPGKVNLSLYVGRPREDGYHPLASVVQAVSLADDVSLEEAAGDRDEVVCAGIAGPNLALRAVELFREATGWDGPPVRIAIDKRVPVAAGMGGGSADAAATLRLLAHAAGDPGEGVLLDLAARLGADVPSQLRPGRYLMTGIGDGLERLPATEEHYVIVPPNEQLPTPAVYAEFDRLGLGRPDIQEGARLLTEGRKEAWPLFVNDLQPAALSLCPSATEALDALREAGALHALVSGSGPTAFGVFGSASEAKAATTTIAGAIAAHPVDAEFAAVRE